MKWQKVWIKWKKYFYQLPAQPFNLQAFIPNFNVCWICQVILGIQPLSWNLLKSTLEMPEASAFYLYPFIYLLCLWGDLVLYFVGGFILWCKIKRQSEQHTLFLPEEETKLIKILSTVFSRVSLFLFVCLLCYSYNIVDIPKTNKQKTTWWLALFL